VVRSSLNLPGSIFARVNRNVLTGATLVFKTINRAFLKEEANNKDGPKKHQK
jgi:hypothetical protein